MATAVIVTTSVSFSLFGIRLSTSIEVGLVKNRWYGKVEISVFLRVERSTGGTCEPGKTTMGVQRKAIEEALKANPEVKEVFYEPKGEAFKEFQRVLRDSPVLASRTAKQMWDSSRIKLLNPKNYREVVSEVQGLQRVQNVRDLRSVLDPVFNALGGPQWTTTGMSVLLLLAAALQIPTTTRIVASTRRREIGIMRLVGAPNFYILLPFLLESLITGLIGVPVSSGSIAITYLPLIEQTARPSISAIAQISTGYIFGTIVCTAVIGVALSVVPMPLATRKYLRI